MAEPLRRKLRVLLPHGGLPGPLPGRDHGSVPAEELPRAAAVGGSVFHLPQEHDEADIRSETLLTVVVGAGGYWGGLGRL